MLKRAIMVLLFLALSAPTWCGAKNINTDDFQKQTGIEVTHKVSQLLPRYANVGQVVDVAKFTALGFKNVKKGDWVKFDVRDDGDVGIISASTGESKLIKIIKGK